MFSTFHDELQYIFLEKHVIFMVSLADKDAGTDVIFVARNKRNLICIASNDVSSDIFNSQKGHEDEVFLYENILHFVVKCTKHHKYAESEMALYAL